MTVILGIDPGSCITGYGVIQQRGDTLHYLGSGAIRTSAAKDFANRLPLIYAGISAVIDQFAPEIVAVEQVFMARNVDTALKLGQARGVAIVAAINANLSLFEYAARQIKQTVTGSGAADKGQVQHMVRLLLRLSSTPSVDAADALAAAITYSHRQAGNGCSARLTGGSVQRI